MKNMFMATISLATLFAAEAVVAGPTCQTENRQLAGSSVKTKVCITQVGMFKPNRVIATVNGKNVFNGTDYDDVVFTGQYEQKQIGGGCVESVTIMDMKTMKPAPLAALPEAVVAACRIDASADGASQPFAQNAGCKDAVDAVFKPLFENFVPTSDARRCTLTLDGDEVFSKDFRLP